MHSLYPHNPKVSKLRQEYSTLFKVFDEVSPISKKLGHGKVCGGTDMAIPEMDEAQYLPNYSLGLSQFGLSQRGSKFPDLEMFRHAKSNMEYIIHLSMRYQSDGMEIMEYAGPDKGKNVVKYSDEQSPLYDSFDRGESQEIVAYNVREQKGDKGKQIVEYKVDDEVVKQRPLQEQKATLSMRSSFVSRVIDIKARVITSEETNVWNWLFQK